MIEEIKAAVATAATENQKYAMFHFQVLKHASKLEGIDPVAFCRDINMPESYKIEFRKMIALDRLLRDQGVFLAQKL